MTRTIVQFKDYIYENKKDSYVNFFLGLVEEQSFY